MSEVPRGQIVILNGAPRSGKSSIAAVIQERFDGVWMNLGVDVFALHVTPPGYRPGMGLRPGEEAHRLHALQPALYAAFVDSIAAHARQGLNVVADVGIHERAILHDAARRLAGLPVLFVGVRCPIAEIMRRRAAAEPGRYAVGTPDDPVPLPVRMWQEAVHAHGAYDLEVDTSQMTAEECGRAIHERLRDGPPGTVFAALAAG